MRCPEWRLPRGTFLGCPGWGTVGDAEWRGLTASSSAGGAWVGDTLLRAMCEAPGGASLGYRISTRVPF